MILEILVGTLLCVLAAACFLSAVGLVATAAWLILVAAFGVPANPHDRPPAGSRYL